MAGEVELRQPVILFGGFARVHDEVGVFRRGPRRDDDAQLALDLAGRNLRRNEGADPRNPFQIPLLHQLADRLADRHVAGVELFGQLPLRRQRGSPRKIADLDLPEQMVPDVCRPFSQCPDLHSRNLHVILSCYIL